MLGRWPPRALGGCAGGASLEGGREPGERHLDQVEIGAVGWKEAELDADSVDGVEQGGAAVDAKLFHHHVAAGLECRRQHLVYVGTAGGPCIAPSSTRGAVMLLGLSAPRKVVVFQCP